MNDELAVNGNSFPMGYYRDPHNPAIERYWDGTAWTESTRPAPEFAQGGITIPAAPGTPQVIVVNNSREKTRKVNHWLHGILTVFTFGLWLPVWIIVAIAKN